MKRALLLTAHMPPSTAIASVRVENMIAAAREHGWEIVPVTAREPLDFRTPIRRMLGVAAGSTTHERFGATQGTALAPPTGKQRAIAFGHSVTGFANGRFGWLGATERSIREMLEKETFDVIISTSPPETTHVVASRVRGSIPWIADMRDPWLRNDAYGARGALRAVDRVIEPLVLRSASAVTTVSEPLAEDLRALHPNATVYTLRNAFSAKDWDHVPFVRPERATFFHAGQFYRGTRNPEPLFEAMAHLLHERLVTPDEVRIDHFGEADPWLERLIAQYGLRRVVHVHATRPRKELFTRERAASRLLVFVRNGADERGTYTGKLFEYFGARRPIVAIGGPPERIVIDDALEASGSGARYRTAHALRDVILQTVQEWRRGETRALLPKSVAQYELADFGKRFADILGRVIAPSSEV